MPQDRWDESGMSALQVIAETRSWVDRVVIGLNLCPFARAVQSRGQIRYVASPAVSADALRSELRQQMHALVTTDAAVVDTTLIIHPLVLQDFLDFNDFLGIADDLLREEDLEGILQVASFHPQFRFAGTAPDAIGNATNRSPYPTLHLLREVSVDRAVAAVPAAEDIYLKNIQTLENLGHEGFARLRARCRDDAFGTASSTPTQGRSAEC